MINEQTLAAVRSELVAALEAPLLDRVSEDSPILGDGCNVRFKRSSCPLPPNAFQLGKTKRVVLMLPQNLQAWALYAYGPKQDWNAIQVVTQELWGAFLDQSSEKFRKKKTEKLKGMAFLAVQNYQNLVLHELPLYESAKVQELLQVSADNYRRDWKPHWQIMNELMAQVDREMLLNVYRNTTKERANFPSNAVA